jgi:hypothetical protein
MEVISFQLMFDIFYQRLNCWTNFAFKFYV